MKTLQRCWHLAIFMGGFLFFLQPNTLNGQCTNIASTLDPYPATAVTLNSDNETTTLTTCAYTGERSVVTNVHAGKSYTVTGTGSAQYITITELGGNVVANGPQPLTFTPPTAVDLYVYRHDNIACVTTTSGCRTITMTCNDCEVAPANDDCAGAIELTVGATCSFSTHTTLGATASVGVPAPGCAAYSGGDVWFSVEVPAGGAILINSSNIDFTDSGMALYSGSCGSLNLIECDDDGSSNANMSAIIRNDLTPGDILYIRFWVYGNNDNGEFDICVRLPVPPPVAPANDECAGAFAFPTIPTDGTCVSMTGNTANATQSQAACIGTANDDVWFSFVAPSTEVDLAVTTISGSGDRVHQVFSGTCGSLFSENCSDPESSTVTGLTIGNTYFVRVYGYFSSSVTEFNLCIGAAPPPPANDECAGAIELTVGETCNFSTYTTLNATGSVGAPAPGCANYSGGDVWFFVTVPASGEITIDSDDIDFTDSGMALYSGTCGSLSLIECDDDGSGNGPFMSSITRDDLNPGDIVYIRLWEYGNDVAGDFDICVTAPPPCNDNEVVINMSDSFGDGWNGNTYTLEDSDGLVVASGTLSSGSSGSDTYCLPDDCYSMTVDGGIFQGEVSWTVEVNGTEVASGGAPDVDVDVSVNVNCCTDNEVTLDLLTDFYGDETSWTLEDSDGVELASAALGSLASDTAYEEDFCLEDGCYTFTINDSFGDGMSFGGTWEISDADDNTIGSGGGNFGSQESIAFNIENGVITTGDSCECIEDEENPTFTDVMADVELYTDDGADCPRDAFDECVDFFSPLVGDEFTPGASFTMAGTSQTYPGTNLFSDDQSAAADIRLFLTSFAKRTDGCEAEITLGWTIVDECDNDSDEQLFQTFFIYDDTKPTLNCRNLNLTVDSDDDACGTYVDVPAPTASDNCQQEVTLEARYRLVDENNNPLGGWSSWMNDPSGFFDVGRYRVRWRATDACGNRRGCTRFLTVEDNTDPTIDCFNQTIVFNGEAVIALNVADLAEADDNCGVTSLTLDINEIYCEELGEEITVTATALDAAGNDVSCTSTVTVDGLPCGWYVDGHVDCEGQEDYDVPSETFSLSSDGCANGITNEDDQYAFIQQTVCGNTMISAEITSVTGSTGWAGVTMRESNDPDSKMVSLMFNGSSNHRREVRSTTGGNVTSQLTSAFNREWVRIRRVGNSFRGYTSSNGSSWFLRFSVSVPMNSCLELGLIVNSYVGSGQTNATFENVEISGGSSPSPIQGITGEDVEATTPVERTFMAYPNPTTGLTTVNLTDYQDVPAILEVVNTFGQVVLQRQLGSIENTQENLDLSNLPAGVYIIRLHPETGESEMIQIIKQ